MKTSLEHREKEHVKIFWDRSRDPEIQALFPSSVDSLAEALALFEESKKDHARSFGKVIYANGAYIGDIWVYCIDEADEKTAMLSIVIFDKACWGRGIGSEIIPRFVQEVFSLYDIESIGAFTYAGNTRARKALEKAGFALVESFMEDGRESVYMEIKRK